MLRISITNADPYPACHFNVDPDPDPIFHIDADLDPDPNPSYQIKAQNLEKVLKWAHFPYILARHLQVDADPDPGITLMRIRILLFNLMRIRIHNTDGMKVVLQCARYRTL